MKETNQLSLLSQLGKRIAFLRKERKMSQLKLSIESNLSKSYLCDLEKGRRNPSLLVLNRIAISLGVSLEELFKGIIPIKELLK